MISRMVGKKRLFNFIIERMVPRWVLLLILCLILGLTGTIIYSCKKNDLSLGVDLLPGVKIIETRYFKDSTSISAYTFIDENFRIDHDSIKDPNPRYNLLGSFNDPLFGYTNAAFSAQFRMPYNPRYEKNPDDGPAVLDSLILQMSYKYAYGDTVSPQTIMVYELADSLNYDARYLPSYKIRDHIVPQVIGSLNYVPKFRTDSTKRDTSSQIIRIPMDPSVANRLLKMDTMNYVSNPKFLSVFKGLYIETAPLSRKGALMRIDAPSGFLVVYYHNSKNDSLAYAYHISDNSAVVSGYQHNYLNTPFYAHLNQETGNDSHVYLQPTGGTKVKINIPSLNTWGDSTNYIINRATLTIHVDTILTDFKRYEIPPFLYLKYIGSNDSEVFPDDMTSSASYYGGIYNPLKGTYEFNLAQHLQRITSNDPKVHIENKGFYLVHPLRNISAKRVVLKKGEGDIYLNVIYTRYRQ